MLEFLIASIVMIVAVLSAFGSQLTSFQLIRTSQESKTALSDLQAAMEQLLLLRLDELPIAGSPFEHESEIEAYAELHLQAEVMTVAYPGYVLGGAIPDPLPILLTVSWLDQKGRARELALSSMRTR